MDINSDFKRKASVQFSQAQWASSPAPGVERLMLDRIGGEIAIATSIVRFAADSEFAPHTHTGGEEYLVLEGVFQDESGDYPAGSYVRNPPGSKHQPKSEQGAMIFVKLQQHPSDDDQFCVINTTKVMQQQLSESRTNTELTLFKHPQEVVKIQQWAANQSIAQENLHGLEILVLRGSFTDQEQTYDQYSWLRLPAGMNLSVKTGESETRVWIKQYKNEHSRQ